MSSTSNFPIRNLAIIAHVDHGKTTLVDGLLRQAGTFSAHEQLQDRAMDSMDLERERGITIQAKNAAIHYKEHKINIVDTPGHADFGGEVERILGMVDGCLLLVDAAEGPLPQTRFVLKKALAFGHRVILVINKVDRPDARVDEVVNATFDLFMDLNANEKQADFPIVYACARAGWAELDEKISKERLAKMTKENPMAGGSLKPLMDLIVQEIPAPQVQGDGPFQMMISNLGYSDYIGRLAIGRVSRGKVKKGGRITCLQENGKAKAFSIAMIYTFEGLKQKEAPELTAGDIGVIAGFEEVGIGDTYSDIQTPEALPRIHVDPPTMSMIFSINTSPLAGKEGEPIQSRKLKERLEKEVRNNVALKLPPAEATDSMEQFRVLGRGELQFAILIEQMRREGFEFMVGRPTVLFKEENGQKLEPHERIFIDVPQVYVGAVTELFQARKGQLLDYKQEQHAGIGESGEVQGRVQLTFVIPTRGLIGIRSRFLTETRGEGIMNTQFEDYLPFKGMLVHRINGTLLADRLGETIEYALFSIEERGTLFVGPGVPIYEGMIIGENAKDNDLNVNACKEKKLTNIRSAGAEFLVTLATPRQMTLERCLEWIDDDEWVEVTPKSVRMRKKVLASNLRSVKRNQE